MTNLLDNLADASSALNNACEWQWQWVTGILYQWINNSEHVTVYNLVK